MNTKSLRQILRYLAGWYLFILFSVFPFILRKPGYIVSTEFLVGYVIYGLVNFILFYLLITFIIPRYFKKDKIGQFVAVIIGVFFLFTLIKFGIGLIFDEQVLKPHRKVVGSGWKLFLDYSIDATRISGFVLIIAIGYRSLVDWMQSEKIRKELENKQLSAELAYLKMQVNPHFLFNALNNIYSLAVLEKTEKTADSVMKLSDMIRYMVYEKEDDQNTVSLSKEIQLINNYIDLQKLRYDKVFISFVIEGEISGRKVMPQLLFPLVENAFKHGIVDDPEDPITFDLKLTEDNLIFNVRNRINEYQKDKTGGIGLENVRKRLELKYPGAHQMEVVRESGHFFVHLQLPV